MNTFVRLSITQPHTIFAATVLLVLFGVLSLFAIPLQMKPSIDKPEITITTDYPGASPEEVEDKITRPIEEAVNAVEGIRKLSSSSVQGRSLVKLTFDWGVDRNAAMVDVLNKLGRVSGLPEEALSPVAEAISSDTSQPMMWIGLQSKSLSSGKTATQAAKSRKGLNAGLSLGQKQPSSKASEKASETSSLNRMRQLIDDVIEPRFRRVEGVGSLIISGGQEREVRILVNLKRLAYHKIPIRTLVAQIRSAHLTVRGGPMDVGKREMVVWTRGRASQLEALEQVVLRRTKQGVVLLKDVAQARSTFKRRQSVMHLNGKPAIAMGILR
ncbi:MAG: efflux RND transporter permease subunit, partial [Myxococcota bacterium]